MTDQERYTDIIRIDHPRSRSQQPFSNRNSRETQIHYKTLWLNRRCRHATLLLVPSLRHCRHASPDMGQEWRGWELYYACLILMWMWWYLVLHLSSPPLSSRLTRTNKAIDDVTLYMTDRQRDRRQAATEHQDGLLLLGRGPRQEEEKIKTSDGGTFSLTYPSLFYLWPAPSFRPSGVFLNNRPAPSGTRGHFDSSAPPRWWFSIFHFLVLLIFIMILLHYFIAPFTIIKFALTQVLSLSFIIYHRHEPKTRNNLFCWWRLIRCCSVGLPLPLLSSHSAINRSKCLLILFGP